MLIYRKTKQNSSVRKRNSLNLIKGITNKPRANIPLKDETLEAFPGCGRKTGLSRELWPEEARKKTRSRNQ